MALEVGFNNTSYFIKKFQQATGMSPHKFRRNLS
ncbi:AraC family transcriptional regulator [Blautia sp.]